MSTESSGVEDGTGVTMRRSLAHIPDVPVVAAPLVLRSATIEDSDDLATLLGRAYPTERWEKGGTREELFGDESVRATLVATTDRRIVATASLQVRPDEPERGQLRWVATEVDWRREGLARALVLGILHTARTTGCREVFLRTTTDLLGAISLYRQLGFESVVEP